MKIYDENLYLYQILKQADVIRKEMEQTYNTLSDIEAKEFKKRMQQIYRIKNNAFSLLIRNGFSCTKENENLVMNINEDKFICKEDAIKTIFQKEYDLLDFIEDSKDDVIQKEIKGDEDREKNKDIANVAPRSSLNNMDIWIAEGPDTEENLGQSESLETIETGEILEYDTEAQTEQTESIETKDTHDAKETKEKREQNDNRTILLQYPSDTEKEKTRQELILDLYTLKMRQPRIEEVQGGSRFKKRRVDNKPNEKIEIVEIKVAPLTIPDSGNELSSDILVYIKSSTGDGVFVSSREGRKSVNVDTDKYNFIVRGEWKNGRFYSRVFTAGETLAERYEMDRKVKELRPGKGENIGLGHPLIYLKEVYEEDGKETESVLKIHAIPLSGKNSEDGYCASTFYLERQDGDATSYITGETGYVVYKFEEEVYKISAKWDRDMYSVTNEHLI